MSLRQAFAGQLAAHSHDRLSAILTSLGLPLGEGTKAQRVDQVLGALMPSQLKSAAKQYLEQHFDWQLEESLFLEQEKAQGIGLSLITRREVARCFEQHQTSICGENALLDFLAFDWPIGTGFDDLAEELGLGGQGIRTRITRHMLRNDNWTVEQLFEEIGAMECSSHRFLRMIERSIHPEARTGDDARRLPSL